MSSSQPEFLFHGTDQPNLSKLHPVQTTGGDNPRESELETAVYATYPVSAAIAFALIKAYRNSPDKPKGKYTLGVRWHEHAVDLELSANIFSSLEKLYGYVYKVANSDFWIKDKSQWRIKDSVDVISVRKVSIEDFKIAGGKIIFE